MGFSKKINSKKYTKSLFCVGLDPSTENLKNWNLPNTAKGALDFCNRILSVALDEIQIFKTQYAFFEQFGIKGLEVLSQVIQTIEQSGSVCILDCKKNDIGSTMKAYGKALLSQQGDFKASAITLSPYLGFQALKPVFVQAEALNATVFVVIRSSNSEGEKIQTAKLADGRNVAEYLADSISMENRKSTKKKLIGAVVGANLNPQDFKNQKLIQKLKGTWILAPGLGVQGANFSSIKTLFKSQLDHVIPTASRSLYSKGYQSSTLKDHIKSYKEASLKLFE